jgi:hypothetical protein
LVIRLAKMITSSFYLFRVVGVALWCVFGLLASCGVEELRSERAALAEPAEYFPSTVFLGHYQENGFANYGSAIIVDDTHLLTNRHFWADGEPWYEGPLPAEKELVLFGELGLQRATFKLVAAGEPGRYFGDDQAILDIRRGRSDWVVIETEQANWKEGRAAPLYAAAFDKTWHPKPGAHLYVAGYASDFMSPELKASLDQGGTLSDSTFSSVMDFIRGGPYLLHGKFLTIEGIPAISTTQIDQVPYGHSGGGVYLWNPSSLRMELVGIFHSWIATTRTITENKSLLGLGVYGKSTTRTEPSAVLKFAPIAGLPFPWWAFDAD